MLVECLCQFLFSVFFVFAHPTSLACSYALLEISSLSLGCAICFESDLEAGQREEIYLSGELTIPIDTFALRVALGDQRCERRDAMISLSRPPNFPGYRALALEDCLMSERVLIWSYHDCTILSSCLCQGYERPADDRRAYNAASATLTSRRGWGSCSWFEGECCLWEFFQWEVLQNGLLAFQCMAKAVDEMGLPRRCVMACGISALLGTFRLPATERWPSARLSSQKCHGVLARSIDMLLRVKPLSHSARTAQDFWIWSPEARTFLRRRTSCSCIKSRRLFSAVFLLEIEQTLHELEV